MTEGAFFQDLAMLMAVAGVVSAVFAKLRWPKVLGYIAAGILLSGNTWGGSFLVDEQSMLTIGQLGVVFLMFTMGLGFSTSEMRKIKSVAMPTALLDIVVMTWLGYTVGTGLFGWGAVPALFLGAAICDSATTMLAKVVGELGWRDRPFVRFALGTSVCEDIFCVGLIALVTGVAQGGGLSLGAAGVSLGGLFVFFLATLVFGFVFVPRLLASIAKTRDDEALLLTLLGVGFFVSYVAWKFEFSLALGAFLVGILGAASDVRERIARLVEPLQSMFASVFFVSIGLLVDPAACLAEAPAIGLLTLTVIVGKFLNCTFGALATGESVKTAVQMGMSLAQIGEFAFMVALLYVGESGDTTGGMYQIVVAVSILTTLANPFLIRWSEPAGEWAEAHLPNRARRWLGAYRGLLEKYASASKLSRARAEARRILVTLAVLAVLEFAVSVAAGLLAERDWSNYSLLFDRHKLLVFSGAFNVFAFALLVPVLSIGRRLGANVARTVVGPGEEQWRLSLRNIVELGVAVVCLGAFVIELTMINVNLHPSDPLEQALVAVVIVAVLAFGWRRLLRTAHHAANRLDEAMTADERRAKLEEVLTVPVPADTLHRLTLPAGSPAIGENVVSLNVRAKTGLTIVSVLRGGKAIRNVGPSLSFRSGDTLVALGDRSQVAALKDILGITS